MQKLGSMEHLVLVLGNKVDQWKNPKEPNVPIASLYFLEKEAKIQGMLLLPKGEQQCFSLLMTSNHNRSDLNQFTHEYFHVGNEKRL